MIPSAAFTLRVALNRKNKQTHMIEKIDEAVAEHAAAPSHSDGKTAEVHNADSALKKALPADDTPPAVALATAVGAALGDGAADTPTRTAIVNMPIERLRPHELNHQIYGITDDIEDLVEGIRKNGLLEPIVVSRDGRIISGHRRYRAAQKLELTEVPVRVFDSEDELDIRSALLEHNRQRCKTKTQIAAEAKEMLEIATAMAARRKKNAAKKKAVENLPPQKSGEGSGKARDAVGKKLGISGRTVDTAVQVAGAIEKLKDEGKESEAAELEAKTNKSFTSALKHAIGKGLIPNPKSKKKADPKNGEKVLDQSEGKGSPSKLDSATALERAEEVLTFLGSIDAEDLTKTERRDWEEMFDELQECRDALQL